MDYIGNKCPVCDRYFHIDDDIVVCPECGTPSHRECYLQNGKCANYDKHAEGYDFQQDIKDNEPQDSGEGLTFCKKCGAKNSDGAFFCTKCGGTLHETNNAQQGNPYQNANGTQNYNQPPFHNSAAPNVILFDPLAGVNPGADLGDGVTVGEAAKFVKTSTPYFITVFNQIKNFAKSRFNFCGMFFGGGYLLFRKMYKLGAIITSIQAAMMILYYYLTYYINSNNSYDKLLDALYEYDTNATTLYLSELSTQQLAIIFLYFAISVVMTVMGIVIGACANRLYFNHCKKQIIKIKAECETQAQCDSLYQKRGGVNMPLAISLWVSYVILSYMPAFFY